LTERSARIEFLVRVCREQGLTFETPALADKVFILVRSTYPSLCEATIKDYRRSIIDSLKKEK